MSFSFSFVGFLPYFLNFTLEVTFIIPVLLACLGGVSNSDSAREKGKLEAVLRRSRQFFHKVFSKGEQNSGATWRVVWDQEYAFRTVEITTCLNAEENDSVERRRNIGHRRESENYAHPLMKQRNYLS